MANVNTRNSPQVIPLFEYRLRLDADVNKLLKDEKRSNPNVEIENEWFFKPCVSHLSLCLLLCLSYIKKELCSIINAHLDFGVKMHWV